MKAVILAGGLGTRMREETEFRPKPMVEVGGKPVMWHIMKIYAQAGISEFIVCAGYKGNVIKNYFYNYAAENMDFTVKLGHNDEVTYHGSHDEFEWTVTVADTGPTTMTGGRIKRVARFIGDEPFLCTYGDGIADVDVTALIAHHQRESRLATMTTTQPTSRFGVVDLDSDGVVQHFREKPRVDDWVNIGFFVFQPDVLDYIDGDETVLEDAPLRALSAENQLSAYRHVGFWQPMDTQREKEQLNAIWESGKAPWKVWQ
ncbi:glucose-1-phosphate cytidylyltransferase [Microcella sp.]|uniref:glucose-1-phosphate cytidylyltransferase n=1 Tax=Microcella sp. TaxID=1913979 RepID=UPI003F70D734